MRGGLVEQISLVLALLALLVLWLVTRDRILPIRDILGGKEHALGAVRGGSCCYEVVNG